jgi:gliding motility-associated protein GldM
MAGALSPRQKMINMMYLVLTALLALNVSRDILNAFVVVNGSLVVTNRNFDSKVSNSYAIFESAWIQNKKKVQENYDKAQKVKKLTQDLINYVESLKVKVVMETDKIPETEALKIVDSVAALKGKDRYDDPTRVFCGNGIEKEKCKGSNASELKKRIEEYKKNLNEILGKDKDKVKLTLITDGKYYNAYKKELNWEQYNFQNIVLIAAVTNLNRIKGEIRNAEFDVINKLYELVGEKDFKFDQIKAKVVPKSKIITLGENYEADIFVAAWDSKQTPEIFIGEFDTITWQPKGATIKLDSKDFVGGVGKYVVGSGGLGDRTVTGVVKVPSVTPGGQPTYYPFTNEYKVIPSTSTVSATKMNVLYVNLDNPVEISVPGTASDKINASITGGSIKRLGNGKFIVNVPKELINKTVKINVSATTASGTTKGAGSMEFRVKGIPTPRSYVVGAAPNGPTNKGALVSMGKVIATLEGFAFEGVTFSVTSYTVTQSGTAKTVPVKGSAFTQEVKNLINSTKSGGKLYFDDIWATGPAGNVKLSAVSVLIQ